MRITSPVSEHDYQFYKGIIHVGFVDLVNFTINCLLITLNNNYLLK